MNSQRQTLNSIFQPSSEVSVKQLALRTHRTRRLEEPSFDEHQYFHLDAVRNFLDVSDLQSAKVRLELVLDSWKHRKQSFQESFTSGDARNELSDLSTLVTRNVAGNLTGDFFSPTWTLLLFDCALFVGEQAILEGSTDRQLKWDVCMEPTAELNSELRFQMIVSGYSSISYNWQPLRKVMMLARWSVQRPLGHSRPDQVFDDPENYFRQVVSESNERAAW